MNPILDTHAIIKSLMSTGLKEKQAETIVKAMLDTKICDLNETATKEDLKKFQIELERVKANLLKWYIGTTMTALTVIATIAASYLGG